jgi:diguanylate cyclase (GGDEF)-like protein
MVEVARDAGRGSDVATPRLIVLGTALLGAPAVVVSQAATNAPGRAAAAGSVVVTVLVLLRVIRLARALELVRLQQHAVLVLGQQALRGDSVEELVDAAEVALSAGLHGARAHVQLVDVGASAGPAEGVVDVRRELRTGSELLGSISVEPTPSATTREDDAFLDAVATTLSSAVVRSRAEERVRYGAMHDPLTALPNRVLLSERLELASTRARRAHGQIALLFIDIDGFKQVNDELGHDVGDAVLVETAGRLTRAVRAADLVARLAGDEFVVLCESIARRSDVMVVAQRILAAIRLASPATGTRPVSASIGVAFSDGFEPGEAFLKRADDAMYAAKRGGRDRVELAPVA